MSKLLQVASGAVYSSSKGVVALDASPRRDALLEVLQEVGRKAIVFIGFLHSVEPVAEFLRANGFSVGVVTGETSLAERNQVFAAFQETADPQVLVAHPGAMAHGLTLTAANTVVWYTPTMNLETYEQANGRITRPGQTSNTLVVHLCGSKIESRILSRLQNKAKVQGALLEMFESATPLL